MNLEDFECEDRRHKAGIIKQQDDYDAQREVQEGIIMRPNMEQADNYLDQFKVGYKIIIDCGCEDGEDDKHIGKKGIIQSIDGAYAEVQLDGEGEDTFQFGLYQLVKDPN